MGKNNTGRRFPALPFTRAEALRLLAACGGGWTGARNRALLAVLYRSGARCQEALGLSVGDVLPGEDGALILRLTKVKGLQNGARPREVGLDSRAAALVLAWIEIRGSDPGPLFRSGKGKPLCTSNVRRLLSRLGKKAGLGRRAHPHAFRHTFARELYEEGVGIKEIQLALGHSTLATTDTYLQSIGATEVVAVTTRRQW